jgi:hypothetical protein
LEANSPYAANVVPLVVRLPRRMFVYGHLPSAMANDIVFVAVVTIINASSDPAPNKPALAKCASWARLGVDSVASVFVEFAG